MRNIKCLILNIKRSSSLTWWSFETCVCWKSTDKTRSTQGDHNTTEKTKGGLNIFPCVGSIMGIRTYIYKLHCKDTDVKDSFIGHTANPNVCKSYYKCKSKYKNGTVFQAIRKNSGWHNWQLTVLEEFEYSHFQQMFNSLFCVFDFCSVLLFYR